MTYRTDLAVEQIKADNIQGDVKVKKRGSVFEITEIIIGNDNYKKETGKGKGRYITLECGNLSRFSDTYEEMATELAHELKQLIPDEGEIFVVGIGNRDITPDAVGVQTAEKIIATRHLQKELQNDAFLTSLRRVSTFSGGVMGQTGIETAEIIKAICKEIKPSAVIAVDALACSDISRLGKTIQISDSGISPGSGVANARKEISSETIGLPVIAVGVPTVVDIYTIVKNVTGLEIKNDLPNMMVTPRDIDRLTERSAQLIAFGINLALQPSLTFDDVRGLF